MSVSGCVFFYGRCSMALQADTPLPNNLSIWQKPERHRLVFYGCSELGGASVIHGMRRSSRSNMRWSHAALQRKPPNRYKFTWWTLLWQHFTSWRMAPSHRGMLITFFSRPSFTPWYSHDYWKNAIADAIPEDASGSWQRLGDTNDIWVSYGGVKRLIACLIY